jgi:hypothetical protein
VLYLWAVGLERTGVVKSEPSLTQKEFVDKVLDLYFSLPDTPNRARRDDRYLAMKWYRQGIALFQIQAAMLLATARRTCRGPEAEPLEPIRSLRYIVPLLEEIQHCGVDKSYAHYLQQTLSSVLGDAVSAESKAADLSVKVV